MKLKIKETGEIVELVGEFKRSDGKPDFTLDTYETLAELCEEVEDYKEPKEYYFITDTGQAKWDTYDNDETDRESKEIGNYFETKEEAEKAVEKLKAWKRLRDKELTFEGYDLDQHCITIEFPYNGLGFSKSEIAEIKKDMDLLFGGEE